MVEHESDKFTSTTPPDEAGANAHDSALSAFAHGIAYSLIQAPYDGVRQIVNAVSDKLGGGQILGERMHFQPNEQPGTTADLFAKAGMAVGAVPWVVGINKAVGAGMARVLAEDSLPLSARFVVPTAQIGLTGAFYSGVLMPSDPKQGVSGRLMNAANGFASFATISALSFGLRGLTAPAFASDAVAARPLYGRVLNAGIFGTAGFGAGIVNAGLNRLEGNEAPSPLSSATEFGIIGAAFGGLAPTGAISAPAFARAGIEPTTRAFASPPSPMPEEADLSAPMENTLLRTADNVGAKPPARPVFEEQTGKVEATDRMTEYQLGPNGLIQTNPKVESVFFKPRPTEVIDPRWGPAPRDLEADAARLSALRKTSGDTPELGDDYVELAMQYAREGERGIKGMVDNLNTALEIRQKLFEPNDPMLGITYNQMFNLTVGRVPPEVSAKYLQNSMDIWENLIRENRQPPFVTKEYMNYYYQRLANTYKSAHQPEEAAKIMQRISN